ncbi:hypothetical protein ACFPGO_00515 [Arcanobacterium canis]|uniref:Uncharacterized protein n=1 Tax=Arcanobacterium canis TaxID=999183 RepID=A0ABY8G0R1_9ACTO|nr:hypothetical protein [Arcanobacterium canis]WFM84177.1 hypothetical protein P7079_04200 [Arcanobacterium canis]
MRRVFSWNTQKRRQGRAEGGSAGRQPHGVFAFVCGDCGYEYGDTSMEKNSVKNKIFAETVRLLVYWDQKWLRALNPLC